MSHHPIRRLGPSLLVGLLVVTTAAEAGPQIAGYRYDGSGVHPDTVRVPVGELKTLWTTALPSWGHSSPISVAGKVFVLVEPVEGERDFPALICLAGDRGTILWEQPLDHLSAVPGGVADAARAAWKDVMADYAIRQRLCREYQKSKDPKTLEEAGYVYNGRWNKVERLDETPIKTKLKIAEKAGFTLETWRHGCSGGSTHCIGAVYATPVSDGTRIWSATAWGGFFCHDLDGKQLWTAYAPGKAGEYCRNGRSPLLWQNLLISDITNLIRAFDAVTGQLKWSHPAPEGSHTIVSPMVLTIGGQDILWAAGCTALRLPDGAPVQVVGWKNEGMQTLVKHDERDVVFFCGSGEHCGWAGKGSAEISAPAAVRFALSGDTLIGTVLWHGGSAAPGNKDFLGGNAPWMLYHQGRFYHRGGQILDPATGAKLAGEQSRNGSGAAVPRTGHLLLAAGGHIYGLNEIKGKDGKPGSALLEIFTVDGNKAGTHNITSAAGESWYGRGFTFGDGRIYARSLTQVYAVGN